MPLQHFMQADLMGVAVSALCFVLIAFLPGYTFGWVSDALRFRSRTLAFRLVASVPLSISLGPILSFAVADLLSMNVLAGVYLCLSATALVLLARVRHHLFTGLISRYRVFYLLLAVWIVVATLSLIDLQFGKRLYFSVIGFDYSVRTAFTHAIAVHGVPARNPFYFPGHGVGLRYHYYWFILCGLVAKWNDARHALIGGTLWCGVGFICVVPLFLRVFTKAAANRLHRRSLFSILLLGITGLDILPALFMARLQAIGLVNGLSPSVEWWNNQIDGWLYTMLWEPHYLCALIACITGFLVLWDIGEESSRWRPIAVSGLAFASAIGSGLYVALVFATFLTVWTGITLSKKEYRKFQNLAYSGLLAATASLPFLLLMQASSGTSEGALFQFTFRHFELGRIILSLFHFENPSLSLLSDILMLPLNYFLELGFFFVVACVGLRRTHHGVAAHTMAITGLVICTFVKSGVIANNDLGWRGFLIAQFVFLIWGGDMLSKLQKRSWVLQSLIWLGFAGVVYDVAILRSFPVLSDSERVPKIAWLAQDNQLGARTYANREAYEWLRANNSTAAIIQQNPDPIYQDTMFGLYGQRQTVAEDRQCGTAFGGNPANCAAILATLRPLYASGKQELVTAACRSLPITVLVAKDTDAAWKDRSSWIWTGKPVYQNEFVRLFRCGS